ncbi:MAG: hypothetical protein ACLFUM_03990 [Spirochaetaceae bacterium]
MRTLVGSAVLFGLLGLVVGYLIFGRTGGGFIPITDLVQVPDNIFQELGQAVRGIQEIRRNILIAGGIGVGVGIIYSAARRS